MTLHDHDQNTIYQIIDETQDYKLVLGVFPKVDHMNGRMAYGVINKTYGTTEGVGPVLPAALTTLYNLQHELDSAREQIKDIRDGVAPDIGQEDDDDLPPPPFGGFH